MSALPLEILTIAFKDLELKDLTQCQLVCKQWNQASVQLLYSKVVIDNYAECRKYVRTIKSAPWLGKYLEIIGTDVIFRKRDSQVKWDEYNLLETIIDHCPNLLELNYGAASAIFWTKLMYAASQDRLPRLRFITCPCDNDYDLYAYTVLVFKKSINELEIPNMFNGVLDLRDSDAASTLIKNLNQFPCLETLTVSYDTEHQISYFDSLIDDCRYLTNLLLLSASYGEVELDVIMPVSSIKPNVLIHTLECSWSLIKMDNQLIYTMKKFPNLKSLRLVCSGYDDNNIKNTSPDILMKFLRFATNIQDFDLHVWSDPEELNNAWANFLNENFKNLSITLGTSIDLETGDSVEVKFEANQLELLFAHSNSTILYCTKFLHRIGKNIQSLSLQNYSDKEVFNSIEKIIRIVQHCPSTQDLSLSFIDNLVFSESTTYQHPEMKTLTLFACKYAGSDGILKNMSLILPNLKTVIIYDTEVIHGKSGTLIIDMPNVSLDIVTWRELKSKINNDYILEIYIRLQTKTGERFYMAFENKLSSITAIQYGYPRDDHIYIDITCKNLVKLGLKKFTYTI